jgi:hypothetical protein
VQVTQDEVLKRLTYLNSVVQACKSQFLEETHLTQKEFEDLLKFVAAMHLTWKQGVKVLQQYIGPKTKLYKLCPEDQTLNTTPLDSYNEEQLEKSIKEIDYKAFEAWYNDLHEGAAVRLKRPTRSAAEILSGQRLKSSEIYNELLILRKDKIEDKSEKLEDIETLAHSLSRVPDFNLDNHLTEFRDKPLPKLYAWCIANSNIVFPYLTLEDARDKLLQPVGKTTRGSEWGFHSGTWYFPGGDPDKDNSILWEVLRQTIIRNFGSDACVDNAPDNEFSPELDNSDSRKEGDIWLIVQRILELLIAPQTATFRPGSSGDKLVSIKNEVDFYVLERVLTDLGDDYGNLYINHNAVNNCRRTVNIPRKRGPAGSGNKQVIEFKPVKIGYQLADRIVTAAKVNPRNREKPEDEPFVKFLTAILDTIVEDLKNDEFYRIPKSFFESPSSVLRSRVRQGPSIKTKTGERTNLYVPFSYVKAADCELMPEITKHGLTAISTEILKNLDTINKFSVEEANFAFPLYEEYLKCAYAVSDETRKQWRTSAKIPDIGCFRALRQGIKPKSKEQSNEDWLEFTQKYIDEIETAAKAITYSYVSGSADERRAITSAIREKTATKGNKRVNTR